MAETKNTATAGDDPAVVLTGMPLVLAIGVLAMANFMAILDMTIVNVAVPHIAGSLAVAANEGTWTITSYSVAEAIMVPLTGWLAQRFGAVRVLTVAALGFGFFSAMCGLSNSLDMLVVARVMQGVCGGPLMPMSQTLVMRIAPKRHTNMALGLWTMTTILAPVAGPILGGNITDGVGWPWAFYINVPVSIAVAFFAWRLLGSRDTPRTKLPVDYMGFVLLVVWVGSLQIMLDNGQNQDWFASKFIVGLAITAVIGFLAFVIWELTDEHPVVDLRVFRNGSFALACVAMTFVFGSFFASVVLIPLWLQTNMGYTATLAGDVVAFNGIFGVVMAPVAAFLISRVDPRALMSTGLCIIAATTFYRVGFAQNMSFGQLIPPQLAFGLGMPLFFVPLMSVSLAMVPPDKTATAAGLINFLRSMSGAVATAILTTYWSDEATRDRSQIVGVIHQPDRVLHALGGTPGHMAPALNMLSDMVQSQSVMLATNRTFFYIAIIVFCVAMGVWMFPKTRGSLAAVAAH